MIEIIENWLKDYPFLYQNLKFVGVIILAAIVYTITKKILIKSIKHLIQKTFDKN